jgi:hypothetical protein
MKKLFLLIVVLTSLSFGQSWNTIVTTTLSEPNVDKTDLFTNKDGNHLLVKRYNGNIVYYNLNSSGVVDAIKTITLETTGDFPNIVGSNEKIYALYKSGNFIKGKYSTNGGTNWTTLPNNISTTANECNGVDAVFQDGLSGGVHLVWATRDNGSNFETYYYRLRESDYSWVDYYPVTNYVSEVGGQPSVTFSTDRIHVSYNTNYFSQPITGSVKSRDKYGSSWQTPQNVIVGSEQSAFEKLVARGDSLFIVFSKFIDGVPITWNLCSKKRGMSGTSWSTVTVLETSVDASVFGVNKTSNNNLHTVYKPGGLLHRFYNGLIWSNAQQINETPEAAYSLGFTSQSNDLYAIWKDGNSNYLKYRQYDAIPIAPQNLTVQATTDYHPKLIWNNNTEADIQKYYVYRSTYNGGYTTPITTVTHNSSTSTQSYIDNAITVPRPGGQAGAKYYYVVSSVDIGQHVSGYSNCVEVTSTNFYWEKRMAENNTGTTDFSLDQNYPNPFNPSTKISYSIKEEGLVTLKVYDILGKEIATLINENKPEGNYEVEFNASALPSGLYIYKIQSGSFSDVKKMLLTK